MRTDAPFKETVMPKGQQGTGAKNKDKLSIEEKQKKKKEKKAAKGK